MPQTARAISEADLLPAIPDGIESPDIEVSPTVFLRRLRRLLLLRYQAAQYLDQLDVRLLDRCIYSTFCDCQSVGGVAGARELLVEARAGGERLLAWRSA
jgi:hypothetical protein